MVENNAPLITKSDLIVSLKEAGIRKGMCLLVEANCEEIGFVVGNNQALIDALIEIVGYQGTIVVPTFTLSNIDPSNQKPREYRAHWNTIRDASRGFDLKLSMPDDEFAAQFIRNDGVTRSYHPLLSFAAWGKYAKLICDKHPLHFALNQDSPLGKVVELGGISLLIGVQCAKSKLLQLAKYENKDEVVSIWSAPIVQHNRVVIKDMLDILDFDEEFYEIDDVMKEQGVLKETYYGNSSFKVFLAKEGVRISSAYVKNPRPK